MSLDTENYVCLVLSNLPATDSKLAEIREKQQLDPVCKILVKYCQNGWPDNKNKACETGKIYWPYRGEISVNKGILMKGNRLIIPIDMREDVLSRIHGSHQGITKCKLRAQDSVWWIGINKDIEKLVRSCDICARSQNDHSEPMISTKFDDRPWKHLGSDLFMLNGHTYLLVIDYFSRYIELAKLGSTTSQDVINHFKSILARHGICDTLTTDNGPQYASQAFRDFTAKYNIKHITSSARYPLGNAESERGVQTIKRMLEKSDDPYISLMNYRATPLANGYSPAELLFGRKLKTLLPQNPANLKPKPVRFKKLQAKENAMRSRSKQNYDLRKQARLKPNLLSGENVYVKDFKVDGKVITEANRPRSYIVDTPRGVISRNRRHLVKIKNSNFDSQECEGEQTDDRENLQNSGNLPNPDYDSKICSTPLSPINSPISSDKHYVTRSGRVSKPPDKLNL